MGESRLALSNRSVPFDFKNVDAEQLSFVADRDKGAALWRGSLAGRGFPAGEGISKALVRDTH